MNDWADHTIAEFDRLIDRHFAAHRTLVVERESAKHWTASIGDDVLYRSGDRDATLRFARTFAERHAGVTLDLRMPETIVYGDGASGHSVRVPTKPVLRAVEA